MGQYAVGQEVGGLFAKCPGLSPFAPLAMSELVLLATQYLFSVNT
jgi:hypothetical protein